MAGCRRSEKRGIPLAQRPTQAPREGKAQEKQEGQPPLFADKTDGQLEKPCKGGKRQHKDLGAAAPLEPRGKPRLPEIPADPRRHLGQKGHTENAEGKRDDGAVQLAPRESLQEGKEGCYAGKLWWRQTINIYRGL